MKQSLLKSTLLFNLIVILTLIMPFNTMLAAPSTESPTVEQATTESSTTEALSTEVTSSEAASIEDPSTEQPATDTSLESISIMHTNDMHGRLKDDGDRSIGMAKLETIKKEQDPTFMFDGGDAFQGLPLSNFDKGESMAKAMNAVGYDAMVVGNHTFDFGYEQAIKYKDLLNFPILSSNVYKDGQLSFTPSYKVTKNDINYSIIGVTTPETKTKTHPNNIQGVTFTEPLQAVQKQMEQLNSTTDVFVILAHLGVDESTPQAWRSTYLIEQLSQMEQFKDKPIILVDGHSHSLFEQGRQITDNAIHVQAGNHLGHYGLVLTDIEKTATGHNLKNTKMSTHGAESHLETAPSSNTQSIVDEALANFEQGTNEVMFYNKELLNGTREFVRTQETNLGNMIADSLYHYGKSAFSSPSDFAVTNGGGIRADLPADQDITLGDIITVLPFGNIIAQIDVPGSDVLAMFEHALSAELTTDENGEQVLGANGAFLQVSDSIKVYYDINKPIGERVEEIRILNPETNNYELLDENRTYKVATNDFLAVGGDGYTMLGGEREEGPSMDKVLADYIKNNLDSIDSYYTTEKTRILPSSMLPSLDPSTEEATTEDISSEDVTTEEITTEKVTTEDMTTEEVATEQSSEDMTTEDVTTEQSSEDMTTEEVATEQSPEDMTTENNSNKSVIEENQLSNEAENEDEIHEHSTIQNNQDDITENKNVVYSDEDQELSDKSTSTDQQDESDNLLPATGQTPFNPLIPAVGFIILGAFSILFTRSKSSFFN